MHPRSVDLDMLPDVSPEANNHATITAGLLIHAAMDGVALGAAVAETEVRDAKGGNLGLLVFWGLMLHKGPAAFSLCTFLLNAGLTHRKILATMSLFALAAPVAAIVTCLGLLGYSNGESVQDNVALALLFSGGTFLYVAACDMLPEIKARAEEVAASRHGGVGSKAWLYWMLVGMLASYGFALASEHGHGGRGAADRPPVGGHHHA